MTNTEYDKLILKVPKESEDYIECSDFVVNAVERIIQKAMDEERNKIIIDTNLRLGIPMENVNKKNPKNCLSQSLQAAGYYANFLMLCITEFFKELYGATAPYPVRHSSQPLQATEYYGGF